MISRRHIRIDVLQTVYELDQQAVSISGDVAEKQILARIDATAALLAANLHLLMRLSSYILRVANQRASKMIRTLEDEQVNVKLADNTYIQALAGNKSLSDMVKKHVRTDLFDEEFLKKIFIPFTQSEAYENYISTNERTPESEKAILLRMHEQCIQNNELTLGLMDEHFLYAGTDQDLIPGWLDKLFTHADTFNFKRILSTEKTDFAIDLIRCYYEKKDVVFQLIEPKLVGWDAERVAIIDLIILHLGICELLYFPTIPEKVSINEYIDLAKDFSTLQSGQFVNGLLDNVRKELTDKNMIVKTPLRKN